MKKMECKYDFIDKDTSKLIIDIGLNETKIKEISKIKKEPDWMLNYRLKSYKKFIELELPNWEKLENIDLNLDDIHYYVKPEGDITDS